MSRPKNLVARVILGGAVLSGLSGCFLNPRDYPGQEAEVQAYNRRQLIG